MIKRGFRVLIMLLSFAYVYSCAENTAVENEIDYYESLDLWAQKNYPHLEKNDTLDGVYWKITKNPNGLTAKPDDSTFVSINYTSMDNTGSYMVNTYDPNLARQLGTFSFVTRYDAPFKFKLGYYYGYYGLTHIHYLALKEMSVGDKIEILTAPAYGYSTSNSIYQGYAGNIGIKSTISVINIELVAMSDNAERDSELETLNYASLNDLDYIKSGIYMKWLVRNTNIADSLRKDSLITLNYTGEFMDGFVFDTNLEEVAEANNIFDADRDYLPISYNYNPQDTSDYGSGNGGTALIQAFKYVVENGMRLGDKVQFITSPEFAYGSSGKYETTGSLIYGYTPLVFTFEILKPEEEE